MRMRGVGSALAVCGLCATLAAGSDEPTAPFPMLGAQMRIAVPAARTRGASSTIVVDAPPGFEVPAHVHTREDETYVITRGRFRFWHGTHVVDAGPGSVVYMPRNEPHQFRNIGRTPGEQVLIIEPAGLERMFLAMSRAHMIVPRDRDAIVRIGARYGITYVKPLAPPR